MTVFIREPSLLPLPADEGSLPTAMAQAAPNRVRFGSRETLRAILWLWRSAVWVVVRCVGVASLLVTLAVLATLPMLQFLVLGYFLHAAGRVARTGRLRDGLPGLVGFAHVGMALLASVVWCLPVWLIQDLALSARWIDPVSQQTRFLSWASPLLSGLVAFHLIVCWLRGAKIRYFLQPWSTAWWTIQTARRPGRLRTVSAACLRAARSLEIDQTFWLGAIGFLGGAVWLSTPVFLLGAGREHPFLGILGGAVLVFVLYHLPFLQMRFAATGRWRAFFELGAVRELERRAPLLWAFGVYATVVLAIPLYLLKIEPVPSGLTWLVTLVFIATMLPLKIIWAWVYACAAHREKRALRPLIWAAGLLALPAAVIYSYLIFLTPYVAQNGSGQLFEQHAFLLPAPLGPFR